MYRYTINVFKDMYYHELTTKEALESRVSVPITTLSIVATLIVYYISKSESLPVLSLTNYLLCLYYFITSVIIVTVVYAAALLLRIFWGNVYDKSASPIAIDNYIKDLEKYYSNCSKNEKEKKIAKDFDSFLSDVYRDATEKNCKSNYKKMKHIRKANMCITVAMILCIFNAIPLFLLNRS